MENKKTRAYHSQIRQKQARETRDRIADATDQLIKSNGYENTTISAIAKSAGVASQTVYAIFNSKQGILMYLLQRYMQNDGSIKEHKPPANGCESLAARIANASSSKNERQQQAMTALGGFELLYPELHSLVLEADKLRRGMLIDYLKRQPREELNQYFAGGAKDKKLDLLLALTDGSLFHHLVKRAGWSNAYFEKILRQLLEQALKNIDFDM